MFIRPLSEFHQSEDEISSKGYKTISPPKVRQGAFGGLLIGCWRIIAVQQSEWQSAQSRKSLQNKPPDGLVPFFVLGEDIRFEAGCILLGLLKDVLLELAE